MTYTIINADGKELYCTDKIKNLPNGERAIKELRTEEMENPYFDLETRKFYNKQN